MTLTPATITLGGAVLPARDRSSVRRHQETRSGLSMRQATAGDVSRTISQQVIYKRSGRLHRPPNCDCWSAQRAILFQANANGEKNPEGWAATKICAALEQLELATGPEGGQEYRHDSYQRRSHHGD